jgi:hypothetical protein
LLLIVGDGIREEIERVTEHLQHFPALDFALGLAEIGLFRENSTDGAPIFVQPRVLAKTQVIQRAVIQLKAPLTTSKVEVTVETGTEVPSTITEEKYYEKLGKAAGSVVVEFVKEIVAEAGDHGLRVEWMKGGPALKYDIPTRETFFNFGSLTKDGKLGDSGLLYWRFKQFSLGLETYYRYLDDLAQLVRDHDPDGEEVSKLVVSQGTPKEAEILTYGPRHRATDYIPLEKLIAVKSEWFAAMGRAIAGIRKAIGE